MKICQSKDTFFHKKRTNSQRSFIIKNLVLVSGFNFNSWGVFIFFWSFLFFFYYCIVPNLFIFFLLTLFTFNVKFFLFTMKNRQNQKVCCILYNYSFRIVKRFMIQRVIKWKTFVLPLCFQSTPMLTKPLVNSFLFCSMKNCQIKTLNFYKEWLSYIMLSVTTITKHLNLFINSPERFWIFE